MFHVAWSALLEGMISPGGLPSRLTSLREVVKTVTSPLCLISLQSLH